MYRAPIIFAVVLLLLIIGTFAIFGGHSSPKHTTGPQVQSLPSYANTNAEVIMTINGIVNGDDAHQAIKITVSQDQRDLDIIQGYSGYVTSHQQFYNTENAYSVFLNAINGYGFLLPLKNSKYPANDSGQCPDGYLYNFELEQNGTDLSNLWASTCGTSVGTLGGNSPELQNLFENQITNYDTLTENVNLGD
jgi:hypothetical protein